MIFKKRLKNTLCHWKKKAFGDSELLRTASFMPIKLVICNSKDSIFGDYLHSICHQEWLIFIQASSQELTK
jgi:hypothetical protein